MNKTMFLVAEGKLLRTEDFHEEKPTWQKISPEDKHVTDFAFHPQWPGVGFISFDGGTLKSANIYDDEPEWTEDA